MLPHKIFKDKLCDLLIGNTLCGDKVFPNQTEVLDANEEIDVSKFPSIQVRIPRELSEEIDSRSDKIGADVLLIVETAGSDAEQQLDSIQEQIQDTINTDQYLRKSLIEEFPEFLTERLRKKQIQRATDPDSHILLGTLVMTFRAIWTEEVTEDETEFI